MTALLPGAGRAETEPAPRAEPELELTEGSRVRVQASGLHESLIGTVLEITEDALVVVADERQTVQVARASITGLDVSVARGRRAGKGALIGALVGAGVFVWMCPPDLKPGFRGGSPNRCTAGEHAGMAAGGALGGAMWGALIGHFIQRDTWVRLGNGSARVSLRPARGRGLVVGVTLEF